MSNFPQTQKYSVVQILLLTKLNSRLINLQIAFVEISLRRKLKIESLPIIHPTKTLNSTHTTSSALDNQRIVMTESAKQFLLGELFLRSDSMVTVLKLTAFSSTKWLSNVFLTQHAPSGIWVLTVHLFPAKLKLFLQEMTRCKSSFTMKWRNRLSATLARL